MTLKSMEHIISKYLNNEASNTEMNNLLIWIEDEDNLKIFKEYLAVNHEINKSLLFDSIKAYKSTLKTPKAIKVIPFYKKSIFRYAVAASVILLISLTFIFNKNDVELITPVIVNNNIKTGTDKAILTLEDGTTVLLNNQQQLISDNVKSDGKELVYSKIDDSNKQIAYNYLTVPRGGQFFVKLADDTQVWLNSESKLKYPVAFTDGKQRTVELLYGEAYFEVSPSTQHKGSKFMVTNNNHEIEVLGTAFNLKAYNDEPNTITTLVEGKISINYKGENYLLLPNQQSNLNRITNTISFNEVANVFNETSWVNGSFSFDNKPLKDIMKVLSRWYDFEEVIFKNKTVENELFVGVLGKNDKIEDVLLNLKSLEIIKDFKFDGKTIIIE